MKHFIIVLFGILVFYRTHGMLHAPPFFFMCNFHGIGEQSDIESGDVALSFSIAGNPEFYVPDQLYNVTSSQSFEALLITGLYTLTDAFLTQMPGYSQAGTNPVGQNLMCSPVHSHYRARPSQNIMFLWRAPREGTGCVSFLATAYQDYQVLFKDTMVYRMCESGAPTSSPLRPDLAGMHNDGVIFRDDFDTSSKFDYALWMSADGAEVSNKCGTVLHGDSAVLCEKSGSREMHGTLLFPKPLMKSVVASITQPAKSVQLAGTFHYSEITVPLNTTTAGVLQFSISAGRCGREDSEDKNIVVSFGSDRCSRWHEIERIKPPTGSGIETRLVHLPLEARKVGTCIRWTQSHQFQLHTTTTTDQSAQRGDLPVKVLESDSTTDAATRGQKESTTESTTRGRYNIYPHDQPYADTPPDLYKSCWAIDNVLISNVANPPEYLYDRFDPIDSSNWLFFPGGGIKHNCQSDANAMQFTQDDQTHNYAVTRDLNLAVEDSSDALLVEEFETTSSTGWLIKGGRRDTVCGTLHRGESLVFDASGKRHTCTPYVDAATVGNIQFYFGLGSGSCHVPQTSKASVRLYTEDENGNTIEMLKRFPFDEHRIPRLFSIPIDNSRNQNKQIRVCWLQKYNSGVGQDVWAIDNIRLFPVLPVNSNNAKSKIIQFGLNLKCGNNPEPNSLNLEFSTDHGRSWRLLHSPCLPGACSRDYQTLTGTFSSVWYPSWKMVTLPLPYSALVPHVRFRWKQASDGKPNWAIDNVYIGSCPAGCNGHGECQEGSCECDFGYTGDSCEATVVSNPTFLMENFGNTEVVSSYSISKIQGASLGYQCGVLSTDKALVFNKDGPRVLVTGDMNTTDARYLQFHIRVGSESSTSECPAPDSMSESVLLEASCNGGVTWKVLKTFPVSMYKSAMMDSVVLPPDTRGDGCKFRWWQPNHSGANQDVWAVDDVSLHKNLYNTLDVEMSDVANVTDMLTINGGTILETYCGKRKTLSFGTDNVNGNMRFIMTEALQISPGYMMQFDLVMGCNKEFTEGIDNKLYLEYSTNHGMTWSLVNTPCYPPQPCDEFKPGTVFDATEYPDWRRVTVLLPEPTWSHGTRFRFRQSYWGTTDTWSIARLYIGQQCSDMCNGHGICHEGLCSCDKGYEGFDCTITTQHDNNIQADFGNGFRPRDNFYHIVGGSVINGGQGCGTVLSGESLYFNGDGVRQLLTKDVDTTSKDFIQFYIRIGGSDDGCNGAEERDEGVLLQYSTDGGTSWKLLKELHHSQYTSPRFVHLVLPTEARKSNTRFRWWQPSHSGRGHDQWAVDEILLGQYDRKPYLQDSFDNFAGTPDQGNWLMVTEGAIGKYCSRENPALVLGNQKNDKFVITRDLSLKPGYIIQFRINVDCLKVFQSHHPVTLQYSHDGGQTWSLVKEPCYQEQDCDGVYMEGSIYHTGTHGGWRLVMIPVTEKVAMHPVIFRWWQPAGYTNSFALDDVYIGPPCPDNCHRNGVCVEGVCQCEAEFRGDSCRYVNDHPHGMVDRFDNIYMPSNYWKRVIGGNHGQGCGILDHGSSLYFNNEGTREAVTVPLDTTQVRMLQFIVRVGSEDGRDSCRHPSNRNEGIVVDYSTDNEISWQNLKMIEPELYNGTTQRVTVALPPEAKSPNTVFRWWQPLGLTGMPRAQWALDSVVVGVNDSNSHGFQDDFNGMMADPYKWMVADHAVPRTTCNSQGNALEFSKNGGQRSAETWDYNVTSTTFLQFDLAMGCGSLYGTLYSVMLEYSVDMGKTWDKVIHECAPPHFQCSGYHLSSEYMSDQNTNWTRVTVPLPHGTISPATRFRWLQNDESPRGNVWAIDNVYLGKGCTWFCSGHGYCKNDICVCDEGFGGPVCVPVKPLPMMLRDDFNRDKAQNDNWKEISGGKTTNVCGPVVSDRALTFNEDKMRMAVTRDLDTSMVNTMEFDFQYGCVGEEPEWPRRQSVLVQYSNNGGITWNLIQEIHHRNESWPQFFSLELPLGSQTNATRFRFWQPKNGGNLQSVWAIDNLFIGTMSMNPMTLASDFSSADVLPDSWLFVNNGETDRYCEENTRSDTSNAGQSALAFKRGPKKGEYSVITRDLDIGPMSIIQFDINVGCGSAATDRYPVHLQYSTDLGKSWQPVVPNCAVEGIARCRDNPLPPSVYYGGTSKYWNRVTVPLDRLPACGAIRFRWYQGEIPQHDFAPEWAIDNVFIGMACMEHCHGQGSCDGMLCFCNDGFTGDLCVSGTKKPNYFKESFFLPKDSAFSRGDSLFGNAVEDSQHVNEDRWSIWSGGRISEQCGNLVSGPSMVFTNSGERSLVTKPIDMLYATTIQFFIKLGCRRKPIPNTASPPVFLQYSNNGGITWNLIEQFDFSATSNKPEYYALNVPEKSRTNSTILRWWQPSTNGTYPEDWAIDEIYIGGDIHGPEVLQDEPARPKDDTWIITPGALLEEACGSDGKVLHFTIDEIQRYAMTTDVSVDESSFLQFYIAVGCEESGECYGISLEYSHDLGKTWKPLYPACLPTEVDCTTYYERSVFRSDVYSGWNRVTVTIPYYARSDTVRFRWIQPSGYQESQDWALGHLYIGSDCKHRCNGHGRCFDAKCICDEGWIGDSCGQSKEALPTSLSDSFDSAPEASNWVKIIGGRAEQVCKVLASGNALHFDGHCTRLLESRDLDLTDAVFIQFIFLYGCNAVPISRNQGVLVEYSGDGGITWAPLRELYFNLYRFPEFVSMKLPKEAKKPGVRIRWWQPEHSGLMLGDWAIDNLRIGGNDINPGSVTGDFNEPVPLQNWLITDNINRKPYCDQPGAFVGETKADEPSSLVSRDIQLESGATLEFLINVGCNIPWDSPVSPVDLQYSTDHGVTWKNLVSQCLTNDPRCQNGPDMATSYYPVTLNGGWQKVMLPLYGLLISNNTRFRWQQKPNGENPQSWAIKDIYMGPSCNDFCNGHGVCRYPQCVCDEGYSGPSCATKEPSLNPTQMKDTFNSSPVNTSKWSTVQGGNIQEPCSKLVEGTALVFNGPGNRVAMTQDLDLRNAKFIQYTASVGGTSASPGCFKPVNREDSVILQYSNDGGITWKTIHTLDHSSYIKPRWDYLTLPLAARTSSTKFRWWQPVPEDGDRPRASWAIDNVFIGGSEINPSNLKVTFNDSQPQNDASWEFHPYGSVENEICSRNKDALYWPEGGGVREFTTNQLIIQSDYMLQFKIMVGCGKKYNACDEFEPVKLLFNKHPQSKEWELLRPLCLPDSMIMMDCEPQAYHAATVYTPDGYRRWTRVTIPLPEKVYSGSTRFKWIQETTGKDAPSWALDDIYIGEKCPEMCRGRGDCINKKCYCDEGYIGKTCTPPRKMLINKLFESFEGGIFSSHWKAVSGGGIGFGCGALIPHAHGKTLYFNGCGTRQAVTAEMDLSRASKIMFALQIGCQAQTSDCNILLSDGPDYRGVLLQYTTDKGATWKLVARHDTRDYLNPKRVAYEIPSEAKRYGVQFRWWQPVHAGTGHDQWAIDQVEIIPSTNGHFMGRRRRYRKRSVFGS